MSNLLTHPLALLSVAIYLYYRPSAKSGAVSGYPLPGKEPGHIDKLFSLGRQWFEDPEFFSKKY